MDWLLKKNGNGNKLIGYNQSDRTETMIKMKCFNNTRFVLFDINLPIHCFMPLFVLKSESQ